VEEDGEKPGAYRTGRPEQTAPGNGAFEAVLNQIVGQVGAARQRPCIAPQGGHAGFDLIEEIVHWTARHLLDSKMPDPADAVTSDIARLHVLLPVIERGAL